jgi:hypothetical protein
MNTTASGSDGDDPLREARAYNHSIYLMVSVPYLLLCTFGAVCYWKIRTASRASRRELEQMTNDEYRMPTEAPIPNDELLG